MVRGSTLKAKTSSKNEVVDALFRGEIQCEIGSNRSLIQET